MDFLVFSALALRERMPREEFDGFERDGSGVSETSVDDTPLKRLEAKFEARFKALEARTARPKIVEIFFQEPTLPSVEQVKEWAGAKTPGVVFLDEFADAITLQGHLPASLFSAAIVMPLINFGYPNDEGITESANPGLPPHHTETSDGVAGVMCQSTKRDDGKELNECENWMFCCTVTTLPYLGALGATIATQFAFVYYIADLSTAPQCAPEVPNVLRIAAVLVLTAYCYGELMESVGMLLWLSQVPAAPKAEYLQLTRDIESGEITGYASGLPWWYKVLAFLLAVAPKMALGGALWWYGSLFIARSPDVADLILNAVAVFFVLDIDDQLFKVAVPQKLRQAIERLPMTAGISNEDEDDDDCGCDVALLSSFCGQWWTFGVMAGMTAAVMLSAC